MLRAERVTADVPVSFLMQHSISIRRLPDGPQHQAKILKEEAESLRLELSDDPASETITLGSLVEVDSGPMLYLGEVRYCGHGLARTVLIEHRLDKKALSLMNEAWKPTSSS